MLKNDADRDSSNNRDNWAYNIKTILNQIGLTYIWENQFNMTVNYNTIKQRIFDIYHQSWYSSINNSTRLDIYSLFKHSFNFEIYLNIITESKFRIALSRLRTSSHNLSIERGRHNNTPRNERICRFCNSGLIENEFLFLLICTKFSEIRSKYIKRYYYTWPTIQKFTNLMSATSKNTVNNLSKFIYYANLIRN